MMASPPDEIHILLIEDNPLDVLWLRRFAEGDAGLTVRHCNSLKEGIQYANRNRVDVVMLDLSLPDSDPEQTLAQFRAYHPHLHVVVLSGYIPPADAIPEDVHYVEKGKQIELRQTIEAVVVQVREEQIQRVCAVAERLQAINETLKKALA